MAARITIIALICLSPLIAGEPVQGITISTHGDGRDWADDPMIPTMRRLKALGANWVTIHPYARIEGDGSVRFRSFDTGSAPRHIDRPIREAHALGLKIMIKPHLAYWGSPFAWRGEITFDDPANRQRFFEDYERWILLVAEASRDADAFVVGTELDQTMSDAAAWRRIIAGVRARTSAHLTYAANWTDFDRVPFWNELDAIGIQAYFPLIADGQQGEEAIRNGWAAVMERLGTFSRRHGRPIVFTELGYSRTFNAPLRPWDGQVDGEAARRIQESCMRLALDAIQSEPAVVGAFLWKWFPDPHPLGRNFQLATPGMKRVIRDAWLPPRS